MDSLAFILAQFDGKPNGWIEVTDTAVKIGLGTLIGGVLTLLTTRMTQSHERKKEFRQHLQTGLEKIASEFEKAFNLMLVTMDHLEGFCRLFRNGAPTDEQRAEWLRMPSENEAKCILAVNEIRGRLLLMGLREAELCLKDIQTKFSLFHVNAANLSRPDLTDDALDAAWTDFKQRRLQFYDKICAAYNIV